MGTLLILISSAAAHTPPPAYLLPRFALAIFVLSALWTLLVLLLYITACPTIVTVDGVKGFTFWGLPILLRWDEVARAERKSFLGCPFLTVSSNRRRQKLWMAMPLADLNGFLVAVGERDGPDSTIVRALTPV